MKNTIMQVTYFSNGPMIRLLIYCHITLYIEKVTSYDQFSHTAKLKNYSFLVLLMKLSKYWNLDEFLKISNKMKNFETFHQAQK